MEKWSKRIIQIRESSNSGRNVGNKNEKLKQLMNGRITPN